MARIDDIKIIVHGKHFAYVNGLLWDFLKESLGYMGQRDSSRKVESWINIQSLHDFDIRIEDSVDVEFFREFILERGYSSTGEWLKEKVRNEMKRRNYEL